MTLNVDSNTTKATGLLITSDKSSGSTDDQGFASLMKNPGGLCIDGGSGDDVIIIGSGENPPGPDGADQEADQESEPVAANKTGTIIDGGSGDDRIIINGLVNGPLEIDGGSGDDVIIIGSGENPASPEGTSTEPAAADETGQTEGNRNVAGGNDGINPEAGIADELVPNPAGPVWIDGGSGDDRIIVNVPVDGPVQIDGGSGDDVIIIGPGGNPPESDSAEPVAANETGKIFGGLHFAGGDGDRYDVHGEVGRIYDLLSDSGLQFRGRFDSWGSAGATVVGETGLTVGEGLNSDNINFRKDGTATINGQLMEEGQTYEPADGGTAKLENGELVVTTAEGYIIKQTAHGSGDQAYINVEVSTGENGVDNGQLPGGLLGQTFDADNEACNGKTGPRAQGEGAIEGDVSDYERPALDPINDNQGRDTVQEDDSVVMENKTPIYTIGGSGDDRVDIHTSGNHTVELGSGDDQVHVDFEDGDSGNSATISGGSGSDTVTLAGSASDYSVSNENDRTIYTDKDGNVIRVLDDVEQVQFEESEV